MGLRDAMKTAAMLKLFTDSFPENFTELRVGSDGEVLGMLRGGVGLADCLTMIKGIQLVDLKVRKTLKRTANQLGAIYPTVGDKDIAAGLEKLEVGKKLIINKAGVELEDDDPNAASLEIQTSSDE